MLTSKISGRCKRRAWARPVVRLLSALVFMLAMSAIGGPPAFAARAQWQVRPNPLAFGRMTAGNALQKSFQIKSIGGATLTGNVSSIFAGPGAADFKVMHGAGPFSLEPGQVLVVTIQYQPTHKGRSAARLTITSNAAVRTRNISVGGVANAALVASSTPTPTATATSTPTPTATPTPQPVNGLSGQILIAGGLNGSNQALNTADLYNVIAGAFDCSGLGGVNTATGACNNVMNSFRYNPSVVALQNGQVLIAGGNGPGGGGVVCYNSAELYNPATNAFAVTGSMIDAHCWYATGTLLNDGRVLIAGGEDATAGSTPNADLYDPVSGTFSCDSLGGVNTKTGYCNNVMTDKRYMHTATLLQNGQVLVAGGNDGKMVNTAELFDPASGTFGCNGLGGADSKGHCLNTMSDSRQWHTATLLSGASGDVLIVGGIDLAGNVQQTAEIFDPTAGAFSCVGGVSAQPPACNKSMTHARYLHTATLLDPAYVSGPNAGSVLITGGQDQNGTALATAELYNPATGTFSLTGNMTTSRALHSAYLINKGPYTGYVLIAGGINDNGETLSSAELYNPNTGQFVATGKMTQARSGVGGANIP